MIEIWNFQHTNPENQIEGIGTWQEVDTTEVRFTKNGQSFVVSVGDNIDDSIAKIDIDEFPDRLTFTVDGEALLVRRVAP